MTPSPPPGLISLAIISSVSDVKWDEESVLDGWLAPEVISLDEPRPPPWEPLLLFMMSEGDWFAGVQAARPQELSLWSWAASPSTVSEPDNAKMFLMDIILLSFYFTCS